MHQFWQFIKNGVLLGILLFIPTGAFLVANQFNQLILIDQSQVAGISITNRIVSYKNTASADVEFLHNEQLKTINYLIEKKTITKGRVEEIIGELQIENQIKLKIESVITGLLPNDLKIGIKQNNTIFWFYDGTGSSIGGEIFIEKSSDIFLVTESTQRINYPLYINLTLEY